jgi:L-ascorbate metabolism protein UlaG (beta-lactamase superfamily)
MRVKLGRPVLTDFAKRFDVPVADAGTPLTVTWLGVATLLVSDGTSALMTDGFFSRPSLAAVRFGRVEPSLERIIGCLERTRVRNLDAVIPVHTHYDHALDSAVVARRTTAVLVGGESAANVGRGHTLTEDRMVVAKPGEPMTFGAYEVTLIESKHCPPDRYPGVITQPITPPAKASAYKCGEAWSVLIRHAQTGCRLLIQGSAGFVEGALAGHQAEVVYLGVGQLGLQPEEYIVDYWTEVVRSVGAHRVVLIHWDDFFHPLTEPLRVLPYAADDLHATMRVLGRLALEDGIRLHMPTVWEPENPWA